MEHTSPAEPIWRPSEERIRRARISAFVEWLARSRGLQFADYESLWRWSTTDLEGFWSAIWQFFDVRASVPYARVLDAPRMP
ncbi:MAG: acetyl-coenzyme A synthetase N-terminal domain-containing protein, partial [Pseudomonadota bacterium]